MHGSDQRTAVIGRSSMSKDGKMRTVTVNGTCRGRPVRNIEIYERR